jgi:endo-1,4-beta-D-glucanase Y
MNGLPRCFLFAFSTLLAVACDSGDADPPGGKAGSGGTSASGGSAGSSAGNPMTSGSGGSVGGTSGSGGSSASAGSSPAGGAPAAGGGGTSGNGGAAPAGGGGVGASAGAAGSAGSSAGSAGNAGSGSMYGARYPFPQNTRLARCTYPTNANAEDARRAYQAWKDEVVTSDGAGGFRRVKRPNSPGGETNSTVSEGIAYGMMIAVAMDDQPLFDDFWRYSQLWLNANGLMHWYINAAGTAVLDDGGATDSDEDMAWALVLADRQWGGQGALDMPYLDLAKRQIDLIWQHEIDHSRGDMVLAGDSWGDTVIFNPSYFAPNEYRVFGQVTGKVAEWNRVIDRGYEIMFASLNAASGNAENGLVPAWCDPNGVPMVPFDGGPTHYQYDSARMPFRIGLDYCYSGEPRAAEYLAKVSQFFAGIGADNITDGYDLDGTPRPDADSPPGSPQSAVFVGTAAVGAMHAPGFQAFIDAAYANVATGELLARSRYYNLSWTTLTLLMLTGNLSEFE